MPIKEKEMLHIVCMMEDVTTIFSESHNDEAPITLTSYDSMTGKTASVDIQYSDMAIILHTMAHPDSATPIEACTGIGTLEEQNQRIRARLNKLFDGFGNARPIA